MGNLRKTLLEAKKKNNDKKKKNGKMLSKLHDLDDKIEDFINNLEDKIMGIEDNPVFIKKANQLLADMSKEYSEFIMALRAIVNAVDRKGQILPSFEKTESKVRDIRDGAGKGPTPEEEDIPPEEEDIPSEEEDTDEFVIAKKDKKEDKGKKKKPKSIKEALEL
jgi:hypothetical protein